VFRALSLTPMHTVALGYFVHRDVSSPPTSIVERWVAMPRLVELVGEPTFTSGTIRTKWEEYQATLAVEPSLKLKNGLYIGQNFEGKLAGVAQFYERMEHDWVRVLKRAEDLVQAILDGNPR
jgi:hypothetical protein